MRSIRLSMVVYFLVLLAVALGAVSVLVYRTAEQTLREKQKATADLLRAKHQAHRDKYQTDKDETLLAEAKMVGNLVQVQAERGAQQYVPHSAVGMLAAALAPDAVGAVPLWGLRAID